MDDIRVKLPIVSLEHKELILKALNYYRLSGIEFSYASDDVIFNVSNLIDIIEMKAELIEIKED